MSTLSNSLRRCGVGRTVSEVVSVLRETNGWMTMRQVERTADMRQPEVSIAVSDLRQYIATKKEKSPGKGRPQKMVCMTDALYAAYLTSLKNKIETETSDRLKALVELMEV
jgi:predicted transcriptional regulator